MTPKAEAHTTLALLRSRSLATAVQQEIERAILRGELAPGAKLNEATIAEGLGVSRGPVREALRMLETAGLVQQEKNRGAFVRHIALDEALEIFELRAMMEEAVGRILAGRITPAQLKALRAQVEAMRRASRGGDIDAYHLLNLEFHNQLVDFAGNRKLAETYRRLINELSLFRRLNLADASLLPPSAAEHDGILKAIESGDAERAGQALREHVELSRERTAKNNAPAETEPPRRLRHA
ncbi:MAG TPA: phosphonate utilization associated transcriptional regulator [Burkholderiaceae bacterium]|nr:phosphonate utilization associated transcriptional regulator [Burkholderiaceae bacterium]